VPTYQYTCTECAEPLEVVQSFTDAPLTVCPACGGRLRKVFSAVGVVFKGSGFYKTDSRVGSGKAAGKDTAATGAPAGDAGGGGGGGDGAGATGAKAKPAGTGASPDGTGGKSAARSGEGSGEPGGAAKKAVSGDSKVA
jgi:putative FmdB family regulatory protein